MRSIHHLLIFSIGLFAVSLQGCDAASAPPNLTHSAPVEIAAPPDPLIEKAISRYELVIVNEPTLARFAFEDFPANSTVYHGITGTIRSTQIRATYFAIADDLTYTKADYTDYLARRTTLARRTWQSLRHEE